MYRILMERAYQENTNDKWDISWYIIYNISYHAMENTVANTIIALHDRKAVSGVPVVLQKMIVLAFNFLVAI